MRKIETPKRPKPHSRAVPKQFGNLHERMKFVMAAMRRAVDLIPTDLWHAVHDLETEVSLHTPVDPPFGRRRVGHGDR